MGEHVEGVGTALVAFFLGGTHVTHVLFASRDAHEAGFLVHQSVHLLGGVAFFVHDVHENTQIQVTGAATHDEAFNRSEAHGGLHRLAIFDGGDRGTTAEVAGHNLRLLPVLADESGSFLGYVFVAGAVESVTADAVFLVILVRHSIEVSLRWHGAVERGVEHSGHRDAGKHFLHGSDALQGTWIV